MLGAALALMTAFTFSLSNITARRGLAKAAASAGSFVSVLIGVPLFLIASLVTGQIFRANQLSGEAFLLLSVAGILHFGVGRYCHNRGLSCIGSTRAAPVAALTTPLAILIAFIFLGESINVQMGLAIVFILMGPAIMVERRKRPAASAVPSGASGTAPAAAFEPRQAEGYLFASFGVLAYGTSPMLIRAAIEGATDVAIFGATVAYTAAAGVLIVTLLHPVRRGLIAEMHWSTVRLFFVSGSLVFLAQLFRFLALSIAPVAVVTSLQRTGGLFTLFLSWLLNRHLEKITWRVVLGILMSVSGTAVLVLVRN